MKRSFLLSLISALTLSAWLCPLTAQDAQPGAAEPSAPAAEALSVPQALSRLHSFNGTPSADAQYYIYLQSASWCHPCVEEMPAIVQAYGEMRASGVELILIGCDDTEEAALKFLEKFGAAFPGIHYKEEQLKSLPGYKPAYGVPDATFVDRQGHVIKRGHGALVKRWKQTLSM